MRGVCAIPLSSRVVARPEQAAPGSLQQECDASGFWPASYLCGCLFCCSDNEATLRPCYAAAVGVIVYFAKKKHSLHTAAIAIILFSMRHTHKLFIEKTVQKPPLSHGQCQLYRKHVCIAPVSVNYTLRSKRLCTYTRASSHCYTYTLAKILVSQSPRLGRRERNQNAAHFQGMCHDISA